jgi:hypothetical protein
MSFAKHAGRGITDLFDSCIGSFPSVYLESLDFFSYLTVKIEEGRVDEIFCPESDCFNIIPHEITEKLVSRDMAFKYLQYDIKVKRCFFQLTCN